MGGAATREMLFPEEKVQRPASTLEKTKVVELSGSLLNEQSSLTEVYTHLDLPLVPVLLRMEKNGVRVDSSLLREMFVAACGND